MNQNLDIKTENGHIVTNDFNLNQIIKAVETESGKSLATAIPAVTFGTDPDEIRYIVLCKCYDDNMYWFVSIGRQKTYDTLKFLISKEDEGGTIIPTESYIIAGELETDAEGNEDLRLNDVKPITVFRFMKAMFDGRKILDDGEGFDINDYDPRSNGEEKDRTILDEI